MKNKNIKRLILFIVPVLIFVLLIVKYKIPNPKIEKNHGKIISGSFDESKLKPDSEWKKILNEKQFYILRQQGTEIPFSGKLNSEKRKGTYYSVGCDIALFKSEHKFDSRTGWPSFTAPAKEDVLVLKEDYDLGYKRIEVLDKCGGHLGHVFDDGPPPTGKRYCMNSEALYFVPDPLDF